MRGIKTLAIAMLALAAMAAALMGVAQAKKERASVKITTIKPELVAGKLTTNIGACKKNRKVVLKYQPPGTGASAAAFTKLGTAKTNKRGKWKRPGSYFVGTYKAIVKPKTIKRRALAGRKEHGVSEEEAEEEDELDDVDAAGKKITCTGTRTRQTED